MPSWLCFPHTKDHSKYFIATKCHTDSKIFCIFGCAIYKIDHYLVKTKSQINWCYTYDSVLKVRGGQGKLKNYYLIRSLHQGIPYSYLEHQLFNIQYQSSIQWVFLDFL